MATYQLLGVLGTGGVATVHRAFHCEQGVEVALKLVPLRDHETAQRFEREVRATQALAHPGIVRVLDAGTCDGGRQGFLAMDLLRGPSLRQVLRDRGALPAPEALAILAQLVDALAHAHRRGILHRDVKPENVMLAERPILIDFGLAQPDDAAALTAAGFCCGSPSYVAPERLLGRPHRATSDVYAAGVVGYELLTGARPFKGDGPVAIAREALAGVSVPLRARAPRVSSVIATFLDRAMARDPARRFPDADAMAAALDAARRRAAADDDATLPARIAAW